MVCVEPRWGRLPLTAPNGLWPAVSRIGCDGQPAFPSDRLADVLVPGLAASTPASGRTPLTWTSRSTRSAASKNAPSTPRTMSRLRRCVIRRRNCWPARPRGRSRGPPGTRFWPSGSSSSPTRSSGCMPCSASTASTRKTCQPDLKPGSTWPAACPRAGHSPVAVFSRVLSALATGSMVPLYLLLLARWPTDPHRRLPSPRTKRQRGAKCSRAAGSSARSPGRDS